MPARFVAACSQCGAATTAVACLQCEQIGCSLHGHKSGHALGVCLWPSSEGELWCWECRDIVNDTRFERVRARVVRQILGTSVPTKDFSTPSSELAKVPYHAHLGLRGFVNMGATCYISVVLQALVHNPLVRAYFLAGGHANQTCKVPGCVACCVDRVYCDFFSSSSVSGYGITDLLIAAAQKKPEMGAGATEQDAHEFLHFLLDELHHSPAVIGTHSDQPLKCGCVAHRNFAGELQSTIACPCGYIRHTRDPLIDVSLDVSHDPQGATLEQCLQRFTAAERVNYRCEQCQNDQVTKRILIARFPPVLCIQLKRFNHAGMGASLTGHKVETPVKFPLEVDLGEYMTEGHPRLIYELYGVVYHQGSLESGHYTCVMKHSSGSWFRFDDTMVTAVDVHDLLHTNAYLLFYIVKWAI